MSISDYLTRPCTIRHRAQTGAVDRYNEPTWTVTETETLCYIEPLQFGNPLREFTEGRETQIGTHVIFFGPGIEVDGSDEFVIDERTYEAVGPPGEYVHPFEGDHHLQVNAREVTG